MTVFKILGLFVKDRLDEATDIQKILTKYGCNIKTRLGLHNVDPKVCSPNGLILLELFGDDKECQALEKELKNIKGLEVQKMVFSKK
jgi:hypothetical protein